MIFTPFSAHCANQLAKYLQEYAMTMQPTTINVPQTVLDDLQYRLAHNRWPEQVEGIDWEYGASLGYMKELVDYWQHKFDWRAQEAYLNSFAQFKTEIDGKPLEFIYERGKGPNPTPIILLHGWPDSVSRYLKLIPLLTDPAVHGGDPNQSFDVIVPTSLIKPVSGPARQQSLLKISEQLWRLMTEELGYQRFAAAGGDGGSVMAQCLAVLHPESIIGIHLTDIGYSAVQAQYDDLSEAEQQYLGTMMGNSYQEGAYAMLLGTKPLTFTYGLNDSPVGWAALVIEKFRSWSDCNGDIESVYTKDELLTNIMLHWVAGIDPRGYREEWVAGSLQPTQQINVPTAVANPPNDLTPIPPREFAARNLKDIRRWTNLPRGGHFVAMEAPAAMADDICAFIRDLNN
jgi:pimeloyl-ACP methyl ester carboxylesterase